jgi:hypothetical protein
LFKDLRASSLFRKRCAFLSFFKKIKKSISSSEGCTRNVWNILVFACYFRRCSRSQTAWISFRQEAAASDIHVLLLEARIGLLYPDFSDNLNYEAQVIEIGHCYCLWDISLFINAMQMQFNESATVLMPPETCSSQHEAHSALAAGPKIYIPYVQCPFPYPLPRPNVYMNTANTIPSPATMTNPPFCESNAGAPAVVDFVVPPVVVGEEEFVLPVAEDAFPLAVEFDVVLPVAFAAPDSVLFVFSAFVEDCSFVSDGSDCVGR